MDKHPISSENQRELNYIVAVAILSITLVIVCMLFVLPKQVA